MYVICMYNVQACKRMEKRLVLIYANACLDMYIAKQKERLVYIYMYKSRRKGEASLYMHVCMYVTRRKREASVS